jgi:hypothetical protein
VAGVSGRGFRCGNADALERKGQRRRHHGDDGNPSKKRSPREEQRSGPSMVTRLSYTVAGIGRTSGAPRRPRTDHHTRPQQSDFRRRKSGLRCRPNRAVKDCRNSAVQQPPAAPRAMAPSWAVGPIPPNAGPVHRSGVGQAGITCQVDSNHPSRGCVELPWTAR